MENIRPNKEFKVELGKLSGAPLNQCMQCGTCSAVCSLAPEERPFPRKEMIWSAWGMKEQLIGNVDIWLCHQCGDCSTSCPREVQPASVIAAVRQKTYEHYMRPRFLARMVSKPALLPVALGIPVVLIILILSLANTFHIPEGKVDYSAFFPHAWLNGSFSLITLVFYLLAAFGIGRFWKDMKRITPAADATKKAKLPVFRVMREIMAHSSFSACGDRKERKWAHMMLLFGFALLILVTIYAIFAVQTHNYPLKWTNPFKILGNLASLMIYAGLGIMAWQRLKRKDVLGKSNYSDWQLIISIFLLTLSGTLVQLARLDNWGAVSYYLYFFHLVTVWFVIMYLPFTKLGHIFYRTAALLYARSIGRK